MTLTACKVITPYGTWSGYFLGGDTGQIHVLIEGDPWSFRLVYVTRLEFSA